MDGAVNDCEFADAQHILLKTRIQVGSVKQIRWAVDLMQSPKGIEALAIVRRTTPAPKIPTGAEWWIENREDILQALQNYQQSGGKGVLIADLDGSLRQTVSGETFINDPDDQEAMAGAVEALNTVPYECIGCTNQLGVKLKHKTLMDTVREQQRTLELFPKLNAIILFCPDDGETCWCVQQDRFWRISDDYPHATIHSFRKPGPGMLFIAMSLAGANPEDSMMIGDRPEDEAAARAANVQFQWADEFRTKGLRGATAL
jgi:D-glycero-D-manno-heptose 1,7-bisphosphate phosphatase